LKFGKFMSKIAKKPIPIPEGTTVTKSDGNLLVKGKKGEISFPILPYLTLELDDKSVVLKPTGTHKQARANWGTMASLTKSAISGVMQGFEKKLEIQGIGYRAQMEGATLSLNVGFTHPVKLVPPQGIQVTVEKNIITISGSNKQAVGQFAAEIRSVKKPEPYKGKGIRYLGEVVREKAGKKVAGATS